GRGRPSRGRVGDRDRTAAIFLKSGNSSTPYAMRPALSLRRSCCRRNDPHLVSVGLTRRGAAPRPRRPPVGGFRPNLIGPTYRSGGTFFHPRNSKWGQIRLKTGPIVASAIEQRPVSALIPYAKNARTHSPAQVTQIVASITEFGFTNPILIDSNGGIIAGHGRVMAAKEMGLATVPCIVLAHLTPARTQSEP